MFTHLIARLVQQGFPEYSLLVILLVPVVTTLVSLFRYVVGWRSLSIYTTILMVFALFQLAQTPQGTDIFSGTIQGLIFMSSIFAVGFPLHSFSKDIRLHYVSRISIIITLSTMAILTAAILIIQTGVTLFNPNAPLSLVILVMTMDVFIKNYIRKPSTKTLIYFAQTIGVAYVVFVLISFKTVQQSILTYPEIILATLVLNFIIGRWQLLRLTEYFRFKSINIKDTHDTQHDSTSA
ncbi:hypothetical protein IT418_01640 [bacterium]|nr:hypothetical protein [bacterium]